MFIKSMALAVCLATVASARTELEPSAFVCKSFKVCDVSSSWGVADAFDMLQPLLGTLHLSPANKFIEVSASSSKFVSESCSCSSPVEVNVKIPVYQQGMVDTISALVDSYMEKSVAPGLKALPQAGCWADASAELAAKSPMCVKPKQAAAPQGSVCKKLTFCQDDANLFAAKEQVTATLQPLFDLINLPAGRFLEFTSLSAKCVSDACCCANPLEVSMRLPVLEDTAVEDVTELVDSWVSENLRDPAESNSVCIKTTAVSKFVQGATCKAQVSAFATVVASAAPTQTVCYCSPPAATAGPAAKAFAPPPASYGYSAGSYGSYGSAKGFAPPATAPTYSTPAAVCYCTAVPASVATAGVPTPGTPAATPGTPAAYIGTPPAKYGYSPPAGTYGYASPPLKAVPATPAATPGSPVTASAVLSPPGKYTPTYGPPPPTYAPKAAPGTPVTTAGVSPATPAKGGYTAPPTAGGYTAIAPPTKVTASGYGAGAPPAKGGYGSYGYGAKSAASTKAATMSTCYCRYDAAAGAFDLAEPACRAALYTKCASGSPLGCSTLDSYYAAGDLASKQAVTELLFEDCPPEAPCACAALSFNGAESGAGKAACCSNLRVACQPLFGGLACAEVEAFCSDNLASPMLSKYVLHELHDVTCEAPQAEAVAAVSAAPAAAGGLSSAQAAGIAVGVVVGLAVLAGVAYSALKAAQAPLGASVPLLAAPGSAATTGPQLLGISS